jgi:alkylation response protein AidB-like acyl-CoA dehydrogenase
MQLAQQLDDRAAEAVGPATLPADLVAELESAGMFQMGLPRGLGGSEVDPMTLVRTAEVLAHADGSTAWTVMTGNGSMFFAWLDHSVAAELLDGRASQPVASSFAPSGQAVETAGGYRVSGRWSYVSGAPHATNIIVAFVIAGECPVVRWGVLPATALEVLPTWNDAAGMRGSGSHDVVADGVFVPAEHTLMPLCEPAMADGALYRLPFFTGVRSLLTGVPLGIARRALDELTEFCAARRAQLCGGVDPANLDNREAGTRSIGRPAHGVHAGRAVRDAQRGRSDESGIRDRRGVIGAGGQRHPAVLARRQRRQPAHRIFEDSMARSRTSAVGTQR